MKNRVVPLMAVIVIAMSAVSFAAGAFASIPDADGVIHACFRKSDGRVRVINSDKGQTCINGERPLDWNRQGRRGPKGPKGAQGVQGLQGDPGVGPNPLTEHLIASCTSLVESQNTVCSTVSWTQPANTIATLYYRSNIVTPGGSCQSVEAVVLGNWKWWLNGTQVSTSGGGFTVGPGETRAVPAVGSFLFPGLLPGEYELKTGGFGTVSLAPDCTGTVLQTEVFVETVASA